MLEETPQLGRGMHQLPEIAQPATAGPAAQGISPLLIEPLEAAKMPRAEVESLDADMRRGIGPQHFVDEAAVIRTVAQSMADADHHRDGEIVDEAAARMVMMVAVMRVAAMMVAVVVTMPMAVVAAAVVATGVMPMPAAAGAAISQKIVLDHV